VPGRVVDGRRDARRRRGYLALTRGMVAVAAGDADEARKQVRRADGLLEDPPLTLLLSAQTAQLSGDSKAAEKFFKAMMDRPETEFLGVRGRLTQALKADDDKAALALAERAAQLRPKSEWVARNLLDLQVRNGVWSDAKATLDRAVKNRLVAEDEAGHRRVVLDFQLSEAARADGDTARATKLLRGAFDRDPGFVPAALRLARSHIENGRGGKAAGFIETAWSHAPHPDLAQAYFDARGANDGLERVKTAERLARSNPDHRESHLTVAEAALEARLWGEARKHLAAAAGDAPSARVCRLMAELEESEHGDTAAAREWLVRASMADPDPAWVCGDCGNTVREWAIVCGNCEAFASFAWGTPPHVIRLAGPAAEAPRAITAGETAGEAPEAAAGDGGKSEAAAGNGGKSEA
jgi:HemY protein